MPADNFIRIAGRHGPVLLADGNVDAADSLAAILAATGHPVRIAHHGAAAMELAASVQPGVAVLDLGMPGAAGYQLAKWIRQQPWGARTPLIALSGWGSEADRALALAAGFDVYLVKPADPGEIERHIASLTGRGGTTGAFVPSAITPAFGASGLS